MTEHRPPRDRDETGRDPMHPHPQDRRADESATDDDSPVDRYRDSPGAATAEEHLEDRGEVPEPNEPG